MDERNSDDEDGPLTHVVPLTEALRLSDVHSEAGTVIDVVSDSEYDKDTPVNLADNIEALKYLKLEFLSNEIDDEHSDKSPFEKLALTMESLTDDKGVLKKILNPGVGYIVPENSLVTIHYNAYAEYCEEPFDSTYLRKSKMTVRLNDNSLIQGLQIGIASMKLQEKSQFLIEPNYAYGPLGCPPRIPPNAAVVFEVELVFFTESVLAIESKEINEENSKMDKFEEYIKRCKLEHAAGNDYFKESKFEKACERYKKAVNLLEKLSLRNEEDEIVWKHLLLKLYSNLSLVYERLGNSRKVCYYGHSVLRLDDENIKALFRLGRAQLKNGEFKLAQFYLKKAQKLDPSNADVQKELERLEKKKQIHYQNEREMCKKMFEEPQKV